MVLGGGRKAGPLGVAWLDELSEPGLRSHCSDPEEVAAVQRVHRDMGGRGAHRRQVRSPPQWGRVGVTLGGCSLESSGCGA